MSTTVDQELEAKVAETMRRLERERNDPAHLLDQMHKLFHRIHAGEVEYGVPWYEAHAAVKSGQIYETFEVCSWLFAINSLNRMVAKSQPGKLTAPISENQIDVRIDAPDREAPVAAQIRLLDEQANDLAFQLEQMHSLFGRIHAGEMEHGVYWPKASAAVRSGQIKETFEVCSWLFDINLLTVLIATAWGEWNMDSLHLKQN